MQMIYPEVSPVAPTLGVGEIGSPWMGVTTIKADMDPIGRIFSVWISQQEDTKKFFPEAVEKAAKPLQSTSARPVFKVYNDHVEKGAIVISRLDVSFTLDGTFRCLTSDHMTPQDDQVVQKMLALTSDDSMDAISTLHPADKILIKKCLCGRQQSL